MDIEGGCYCGALRYEAKGEAVFKGQCHCRECRYVSGGSANLIMGMLDSDFAYTNGAPAIFQRADLDEGVIREFCTTCGTHILSRSTSAPGVALLKVGTLDDPSVYSGPDVAIYVSEKHDYHLVSDAIPQFARLPA